jgi:hypothetical protein
VKPFFAVCLCAAFALFPGIVAAQVEAAPAATGGEAEVMSDPVPPEIVTSAVAAVGKLGDEVVLGRYQAAVDRMNPLWKERTAKRMGGKDELEKKLAAVAAQMVQQGISMISFKPQGQPRVYQVSPTSRKVKVDGVEEDRLVYEQWMIFVPTVTKFRIMQKVDGQAPRSYMIESTGFQVAISDKGKEDWTFIDGANLNTADLRSLFVTLPQDLQLPPVGKKEVR